MRERAHPEHLMQGNQSPNSKIHFIVVGECEPLLTSPFRAPLSLNVMSGESQDDTQGRIRPSSRTACKSESAHNHLFTPYLHFPVVTRPQTTPHSSSSSILRTVTLMAWSRLYLSLPKFHSYYTHRKVVSHNIFADNRGEKGRRTYDTTVLITSIDTRGLGTDACNACLGVPALVVLVVDMIHLP